MWFVTIIWRSLFRRKARSLMTIAGISVALGAVVALVGTAEGFVNSFVDIFRARHIHVLVIKEGKAQRLTSFLDESIGDRLAEVPDVRQVVPALVDLTSFDDAGLVAVTVNGWRSDCPLLYDIQILAGRRITDDDRAVVMLGELLAKRLDKRVGDRIELELEKFEVIGIYRSFNATENGSLVIPLSTMGELWDLPGKVSGFGLVLEEESRLGDELDEVCQVIEGMADDDGRPLALEAMPTRDYVQSTMEIQAVRAMAWGTSLIAITIGLVGVLNTMMMSVFERTAEIGILRAIGWRKRRIVSLVIGESLLLSLIGTLLGCLVGAGMVFLLNHIPGLGNLLVYKIAPWVFGLGALLGVAMGSLGGLYPAWRAASLPPTEAMRHA